MSYPDLFLSQSEVYQACREVIRSNVPFFIDKFRTPTINIGGRRAMYRVDGEKLIEQIKAFYADGKGHAKDVTAVCLSPQARAMQTPRDGL